MRVVDVAGGRQCDPGQEPGSARVKSFRAEQVGLNRIYKGLVDGGEVSLSAKSMYCLQASVMKEAKNAFRGTFVSGQKAFVKRLKVDSGVLMIVRSVN